MTSQHTDISDLSVVAEPALQVWSSGNENHGLDARLEVTRLDAAAGTAAAGRVDAATADAAEVAQTRVAVRDSRYPTGPALVFSVESWNALLNGATDLVDLR